MLYEIKLVTKCTYGRAAAGRQLLRLMPADWPESQRLIAGSIDIRPAPSQRSDRYDFFGNRTTEVSFSEAIKEVVFVVRARVDRFAQPSALDLSPKLGRLAAEIAAVQSLDPMSPHHYVDASPLVRPSAPITDYVHRTIDMNGTTLEVVKAINAALHRDMRYDGEATTVDTPLEEAFAKRRGVCQDCRPRPGVIESHLHRRRGVRQQIRRRVPHPHRSDRSGRHPPRRAGRSA